MGSKIKELDNITEDEKREYMEPFLLELGKHLMGVWQAFNLENEICATYKEDNIGRFFLSFVPEKKLPFYMDMEKLVENRTQSLREENARLKQALDIATDALIEVNRIKNKRFDNRTHD